VGVGGSGVRNDCVRLSHNALASSLAMPGLASRLVARGEGGSFRGAHILPKMDRQPRFGTRMVSVGSVRQQVTDHVNGGNAE